MSKHANVAEYPDHADQAPGYRYFRTEHTYTIGNANTKDQEPVLAALAVEALRKKVEARGATFDPAGVKYEETRFRFEDSDNWEKRTRIVLTTWTPETDRRFVVTGPALATVEDVDKAIEAALKSRAEMKSKGKK